MVFAFVSLFVIALLSLIITRVATLALTATGLSRESARFQARSALTGVGFTTDESEAIVNHPVRRRIVMLLMLVGNAGFITVVGSLLLTFVNSAGRTQTLSRAAILVGGLFLLFALARSAWVDRRLTRVIGRVLTRFTDLDVRDYAGILRLHGEYEVSELQIQPDDWLAGRTLAELDLPHEGVLVLGIVRRDGRYIGAPTGRDLLEAGDVVLLYGRDSIVFELDERRAGGEGDRAHAEAVARQRAVEDAEHRAAATRS